LLKEYNYNTIASKVTTKNNKRNKGRLIKTFQRYCIAVLGAVVLSMPLYAQAQADMPVQAPVPVKHTWNLTNADIHTVIEAVSDETGKNFVVDPRVTGKVSLVSSTPLDAKALYKVLLSVLDVYGYSAVTSGGVTKILPNKNAAQDNIAIASSDQPGEGAELVVRVVPVHDISAVQIAGVLRPLVPAWSHVSAYGPSNILILTGHADNVKRMTAMINDIDQASENTIDLVPLKTANATQIAGLLKSVQTADPSNAQHNKATVVADEKNNRLLVSGDKIERMRARALIEQLDDTQGDQQPGTEVIYLHYLKAKDFAPMIEKIAQGSAANLEKGSAKQSQNIQIQAEEGTNALVVSASPSVMRDIKRSVGKLDVRPAQVLVQAVIVELSASSTERLGIQWGMVDDASDDDLASSIGQTGLGVGIIRAGNFRALISAVKGISNVDVLSQPTIVVLDNKEASFSVGKQVLVINSSTGAANEATASGIPFTTSSYDRQNVGLELNVTPQIGQGDVVQLMIQQKNDTLQNPNNPGDKPIVNNSEIKTNVVVNSGDILVLGGLMSNSMMDGLNKTPFFGDIPVIGNIFNSKEDSLEKKNLLVFIHPIILRTPTDGTRISEARYENMRRTQRYWHDNWLDDSDSPKDRELPPRHGLLKLPDPFGD